MLLDAQLREIFANTRTIALIGAKDKEGQPVDRVGRYLIAAGFKVLPVHPARENVWGLKTYRSLEQIPEPVDLVNLFRAPEFCLAHAEECLRLSPLPKVFWMQLGIRNAAAGGLLADKGVRVVEDACIMVEHRRIMSVASAAGSTESSRSSVKPHNAPGSTFPGGVGNSGA